MKEATFIYKPVQNEAHINSLEFHIHVLRLKAHGSGNII